MRLSGSQKPDTQYWVEITKHLSNCCKAPIAYFNHKDNVEGYFSSIPFCGACGEWPLPTMEQIKKCMEPD